MLVSLRKVSKSCDGSVTLTCNVDVVSSCFERVTFCVNSEDTEGLMESQAALKGLVVICPSVMDVDGGGSGRCRIDIFETDLCENCG